MRPTKHGEGSHHQRVPAYDSTTSQSGTPSSSFVSTLSNALNITPKPKSARQETHLSDPAKLAQNVSIPCYASTSKSQAMRTPTRSKEPNPILSLSGHEAFQSPNTPGSPWVAAPTSTVAADASVMTHRPHHHAGQPSTSSALDHDWFTSAPSSNRISTIFEMSADSTASAPFAVLSNPNARDKTRPGSTWEDVTDSVIDSSIAMTPFSPVIFAGYRDHSQDGIGIGEKSTSHQATIPRSTLSPATATALSPVQISPAFTLNMMDDPFLSSIFEQDTPSLSTHLLPTDDLTEYLPSQGDPPAMSAFDVDPRPDNANSSMHGAKPSIHAFQGSADRRLIAHFRDAIALGDAADHTPAARTESIQDHTAVTQQRYKHPSHHSETVLDVPRGSPPVSNARAGHAFADVGMPDSDHSKRLDRVSSYGDRLAGLGLDLDAASMPERVEVLTSPPGATNRSSMPVDEMGRWRLDSQHQQPEWLWPSEASTRGSDGKGGTWTAQRTSMTSLSTSTEASFTSQSNSSTWDSSFNDLSSPTAGATSAKTGSPSVSTPASSVGFSGSRNLHPAKFSDQLRISSESQSAVATPEVSMHDFSEFGQSVSIEQMAEQRWRTWPRNATVSIQRDASSSSAVNPAATVQSSTADEPRSSFESLSVSTSSTRSRLMAEPYNKNMRSGRPSSSASTSSRGSIGNAAGFEAQQTSGSAGPTRPRSYIATGSLRMSSTARSTSNSVIGPGSDTNSSASERVAGTALALRRARGMSHSVFSTSSSSAMKSSRSADAFVPLSSASANAANFRHSVGMQRAATSVDSPSRSGQRPQSMLDASSHSESPRQLVGGLESKPKGRVGFNEVSAALDMLRVFLKQKGSSETNTSPDQSSPTKTKEASSPSKPSRTLRRARGVLPPRGTVSHVDEFGTLQTAAPSSSAPVLDYTPVPSADHKRTQSLGGATHASSAKQQDDRLAVLEDVSERVMRLQAETELEKERHAAASMPPPTARPASVMHHQRTQSSMTRREMHEEYLRKRASGC